MLRLVLRLNFLFQHSRFQKIVNVENLPQLAGLPQAARDEESLLSGKLWVARLLSKVLRKVPAYAFDFSDCLHLDEAVAPHLRYRICDVRREGHRKMESMVVNGWLLVQALRASVLKFNDDEVLLRAPRFGDASYIASPLKVRGCDVPHVFSKRVGHELRHLAPRFLVRRYQAADASTRPP